MRLLVAEDDDDLALSISASLRQMGHAVDTTGDGMHAAAMLAIEPYDLVVLDLGLARRDGLRVLGDLRAGGSRVPVLILTARGEPEDRVQGLDAGADDYLVKPFHLAELDARVRALLRRRAGGGDTLIRHGPLTFDTVSREARIDGLELALTGRERGVLEILLGARGRVISKEHIAAHLFSFDDEVNLSAIELYVHRLRRKLHGVSIRTVRGLGYILEPDD